MATSRRMEKINKHIQRTLGEILLEEADLPPDVLVTISRVDTTPNLKSASVYLYVFPETASDDILERLKPQMYDLQGSLNRALDVRPLPRIYLRIDYGAAHADTINKALEKLASTEEDE
jgi:ribosome-binding factor A